MLRRSGDGGMLQSNGVVVLLVERVKESLKLSVHTYRKENVAVPTEVEISFVDQGSSVFGNRRAWFVFTYRH